MSVEAKLREEVRRRAGGRCEYCLMPERWAELRFQLDHIVPEQHGGPTAGKNLAWACPRCNKHKGPNLAGIDPESGSLTPLFDPRTDKWREHFAWRGAELAGRSPKGRATVQVLRINRADAVLVRQALMEEGEGFDPPV